MKSITLYINLKINSKPHLLECMQINGGGEPPQLRVYKGY